MFVLILLFSFLSCHSSTNDDDEYFETSGTGAFLTFAIPQDWQNKKFEAVPARFGIPNYNGNREGRIVIPARKENYSGCSPYTDEDKKYWVKDSIIMLSRGNCTFIDKALNVEEENDIYAMIIVDHQDNPHVMSPPEDFDHNRVHKPAVMIGNTHGDQILDLLKLDSSEYNRPIITSIHWNVPRPGGIVELTFYTSSNDAEDAEFKKNFRALANQLKLQNKLKFTPMYFIEAGKDWDCEGNTAWCGDQCTNLGRYCAVDPDHVLEQGMAGNHVVEENVRQMCIWNYTQVVTNEDIWWDYVDRFDTFCLKQKNPDGSHKYTEECSHQVMDLIVLGLKDYVKGCFEQYGTIGFMTDGTNALLDWAISEREKRDIDLLPSFSINDFETLGSWQCSNDPSVNTCNVFNAVCAGYLDDEQPDLCKNDFGCPAGKFKDECGECVGSSPVDSEKECQAYLTDTTGASKSAVVGLTVVLALLAVLVGGCMFFLWKKFGEHSRIIETTKQYLELEDEDEPNHGIGNPTTQI